MAVIRSGATADEWTIDPTSKAGRVTLYDAAGNPLGERKVTYQAGGRLAAGTGLSFVFTASTSKQFLTIHHLNTATKLVRILKAWLTVISCSAASQIIAELVSISAAPVTGNPAITPIPLSRASAAAESTVLALPTTAGTEVTTTTGIGTTTLDFTGASVQTDVATQGVPTVLWQFNPLSPSETPVIRVGSTEGWAIRLFPNATTPTVVATCGFEFTEE